MGLSELVVVDADMIADASLFGERKIQEKFRSRISGGRRSGAE
jgi:hypothetical protein